MQLSVDSLLTRLQAAAPRYSEGLVFTLIKAQHSRLLCLHRSVQHWKLYCCRQLSVHSELLSSTCSLRPL